ncbi:patatin family protein [Prevotella sp. tf2-5]|uniref:patatin-like phospholipase family protein n=1 Tax=Prevotella sp. tf2-5 TaxID=1761889 RepID=UPI0008F00C61|nr:patatin family protein [Prevotella sp. tf2-5]SFO55357.1 Predicted phospholipase, patatin/cPLA2 family [Prevotella sp. tf2-5]
MRRGLVLEGGAMRGLWSAGVTDVMMEHGVEPDGLIGVSAGAAFGCNYKSRQIGRAIRYNTRFAKDARYSGIRSLLRSGNYFNAEFGYHVVPYEYDVFDTQTFEQNPMRFTVVCTDVLTGQAVYHDIDHVDYEELEWLRASASMPLASKVVKVQGHQLLDGGVSDSIPLEYYERQGFNRNVVILTQPKGFVKEPNKLMPVMRIALRKYPKMLKAMDERHVMYNHELDYVAEAERQGRCLVIRPDGKIPIGHISHNPDEMRHVYEMGRTIGERYIEQIKEFYKS